MTGLVLGHLMYGVMDSVQVQGLCSLSQVELAGSSAVLVGIGKYCRARAKEYQELILKQISLGFTMTKSLGFNVYCLELIKKSSAPSNTRNSSTDWCQCLLTR